MSIGPTDIASHLSRMPAQPFAATLILRLVDDPDASPAQLARLVEMDPVLSARVMRLANSPHYRVRTGVTSVSPRSSCSASPQCAVLRQQLRRACSATKSISVR